MDTRKVFYHCLTAAREAVRRQKNNHDEALVNRLAFLCHQQQVPLEQAVQLTAMRGDIDLDAELVRQIFYSFYETDVEQILPDKYLSHQALCSYRTEYFLLSHYSFRRNVISGQAEYQVNDAEDDEWHLLTDEVRKQMTLQASQMGLEAWDRNLDLYIGSRTIPHYNPVDDYLAQLPEWDGRDRVAMLAAMVHTSQQDWDALLHRWLLAMVARWRGFAPHEGADMMLVLVGDKVENLLLFCRHMLPNALLPYMGECVGFQDYTDFLLALRQNVLLSINRIDEQRPSLQPLFDFLLHRDVAPLREPYGKMINRSSRYAALVAATDNLHPIVDPAVGRRMVCVHADKVDLEAAGVDPAQLYAQLCEELDDGEEWWYDATQMENIRVQNGPFQKTDSLEQMVKLMFRHEQPGEKIKPLFVDDIVGRIQVEYPYWSSEGNANQDVGYALQHAGFRRTRRNGRSAYFAVPRDLQMAAHAAKHRVEVKQQEDENPLASALLHGLGSLLNKQKHDDE